MVTIREFPDNKIVFLVHDLVPEIISQEESFLLALEKAAGLSADTFLKSGESMAFLIQSKNPIGGLLFISDVHHCTSWEEVKPDLIREVRKSEMSRDCEVMFHHNPKLKESPSEGNYKKIFLKLLEEN